MLELKFANFIYFTFCPLLLNSVGLFWRPKKAIFLVCMTILQLNKQLGTYKSVIFTSFFSFFSASWQYAHFISEYKQTVYIERVLVGGCAKITFFNICRGKERMCNIFSGCARNPIKTPWNWRPWGMVYDYVKHCKRITKSHVPFNNTLKSESKNNL